MLTQEGFFFLSDWMPMDNHGGSLFMFGCDQSTKLNKDLRKEVDTVFNHNTQRSGSCLDIRYMFSFPFFSLHFTAGGALSSCFLKPYASSPLQWWMTDFFIPSVQWPLLYVSQSQTEQLLAPQFDTQTIKLSSFKDQGDLSTSLYPPHTN